MLFSSMYSNSIKINWTIFAVNGMKNIIGENKNRTKPPTCKRTNFGHACFHRSIWPLFHFWIFHCGPIDLKSHRIHSFACEIFSEKLSVKSKSARNYAEISFIIHRSSKNRSEFIPVWVFRWVFFRFGSSIQNAFLFNLKPINDNWDR